MTGSLRMSRERGIWCARPASAIEPPRVLPLAPRRAQAIAARARPTRRPETAMLVEDTPIAGLRIVTPRRFGDPRGFFSETWSSRAFEAVAPGARFVQDNHSLSLRAGTIRGLHYQSPPHAQGKLVHCVRGSIWDAAVDVRIGSPTFGNWFGIELSADNGRQLWIPEGFLHGFITLVPNVEVIYKCTAFYEQKADGAVKWDSCGVDWPPLKPILSDKDFSAQRFENWSSPFRYLIG